MEELGDTMIIWGYRIGFFFAAIFPFILALVQVPLAILYCIRRIRTKRGVKGWVVYWLLAVGYLIYLFCGEPYGLTGVPQFFWLCYVPGIFFFFAGKMSDRWSINQQLN
ncbi:MAG: hypothetical protein IM638_09365 [Bacteroidetes bacterium]|nr:hypothetical protein [Bacteroidota bacterium]